MAYQTINRSFVMDELDIEHIIPVLQDGYQI